MLSDPISLINYLSSTEIYTLSLHDALPIFAEAGTQVADRVYNYAMQQSVRAARPLLSPLRPTSPQTVASRSRDNTPAPHSVRHTLRRVHRATYTGAQRL